MRHLDGEVLRGHVAALILDVHVESLCHRPERLTLKPAPKGPCVRYSFYSHLHTNTSTQRLTSTHKQTHIYTQTNFSLAWHTNRLTSTHRLTATHKQTHSYTPTHTDTQTNSHLHTNRLMSRLAHKQTHIYTQTDRHRHNNRLTATHKETHSYTQTHTDTQTD